MCVLIFFLICPFLYLIEELCNQAQNKINRASHCKSRLKNRDEMEIHFTEQEGYGNVSFVKHLDIEAVKCLWS